MRNLKAWKRLIKAYGAANELLAALAGIEAHDNDFYEQEKLAALAEKILAIVERLQVLHLWYGQQIDGGSDDF